MFCASVRQIRTHEADMIILCCVTYIARLSITSFRTPGYMLSCKFRGWLYFVVSRLLHSFLRSGLTRVRWEDTRTAAWTSQQVIFLAFKFDAQVKYSSQQEVFFASKPDVQVKYSIQQVLLAWLLFCWMTYWYQLKNNAIQERRRRLHTSSSCSHRWQQTCDQVNAIFYFQSNFLNYTKYYSN